MGEVYKKFTTTLYEARYKVEEDQSGMRLDQYCSEFLASFSSFWFDSGLQERSGLNATWSLNAGMCPTRPTGSPGSMPVF